MYRPDPEGLVFGGSSAPPPVTDTPRVDYPTSLPRCGNGGRAPLGPASGVGHAAGLFHGVGGRQQEDLGVDVPAERFVEAAREHDAHIVGMSALLTTTMPGMEKTIKALKDAGISAKVMIGGAPVTQGYADKIGADGYSADAASAVDMAKKLVA